MQMMIEIDEKTVQEVKWKGLWLSPKYEEDLVKAIKNGIPLPKGHGDLVDRDAINDKFNDIYREHKSYLCKMDYRYLMNALCKYLEIAPTIIEADKE